MTMRTNLRQDEMVTPTSETFVNGRAPQACGSCRKQKRKCNKTLPSCSLCSRLGRECDYAESNSTSPSSDDFAALQQKVDDLEARLDEKNRRDSVGESLMKSSIFQVSSHAFPTMFFLDSEIY